MEIDLNSPGPGPLSQADLLWDSLIDTFPFLTNQAHRALNIQLDFFRNMSTMNLPIPQDANAKAKLKAILSKAELVNEIVSSLTHSSELLIQLKEIEHGEVIAVRKAEVSNMISEASVNIERVIAMQTEEVKRGLGQQGAAPGVAEVPEQQRRAEQEIFMQQRNGGLVVGAPDSPESRMSYVQSPVLQQSHAPQQNIISEQIPGLRHASVPPAVPQGYNPGPLDSPGPVPPQPPAHPQAPVPGPAPVWSPPNTQSSSSISSSSGPWSCTRACSICDTHSSPAHPQNPIHAQLPAHPLPQPIPVQRQDSVYTETSDTSSEDSEIRLMLARELKKHNQNDRATKKMAKMKRERERGGFCKRCGRC